MKTKDLSEQIFGNWTVIEFYEYKKSPNGTTNATWLCECVCGNKKYVRANHLLNGKSLSCGCYGNKKGLTSRNNMIYRYKYNARYRNIQWDLSDEQTINLLMGNCHYCNTTPNNSHSISQSGGTFVYNGIDRMNNDAGYNHNNCVSCCKICNHMKSDTEYNMFLKWVKQLVEFQDNKTKSLFIGITESKTIKTYISRLKESALKRNIEWNIDDENAFYLSQCSCHYCGNGLLNLYKRKNISFNGLDRIDNKGIYELSNVVTCCKICNQAKTDLDVNEFINHIYSIHGVIHNGI